jgi:hypothetical protein
LERALAFFFEQGAPPDGDISGIRAADTTDEGFEPYDEEMYKDVIPVVGGRFNVLLDEDGLSHDRSSLPCLLPSSSAPLPRLFLNSCCVVLCCLSFVSGVLLCCLLISCCVVLSCNSLALPYIVVLCCLILNFLVIVLSWTNEILPSATAYLSQPTPTHLR